MCYENEKPPMIYLSKMGITAFQRMKILRFALSCACSFFIIRRRGRKSLYKTEKSRALSKKVLIFACKWSKLIGVCNIKNIIRRTNYDKLSEA